MKPIMVLVFLLSTVLSAYAQQEPFTAVFPIIADGVLQDGSYYKTSVTTINASSLPSSCVLTTHYMVPRTTNISIAFQPWQWLITRLPGDSAFSSAYGVATCNQPVANLAIYSFYSPSGVKTGEATVLPAAPGTVLQYVVDQTGGSRLGVAIVNDSDVPQTVKLTIYSAEGTVAAEKELAMSAREVQTKFVDEFTGWSGTLGVALLTSQFPVYSAGLRFTGNVFTTVPALVLRP
jgi:hypothetical protein